MPGTLRPAISGCIDVQPGPRADRRTDPTPTGAVRRRWDVSTPGTTRRPTTSGGCPHSPQQGYGRPRHDSRNTAVLAWRSPEIRESSGLRLSGWNDVLTSGSGFINPLASSKALTAGSTHSRWIPIPSDRQRCRWRTSSISPPRRRNRDLSPGPAFTTDQMQRPVGPEVEAPAPCSDKKVSNVVGALSRLSVSFALPASGSRSGWRSWPSRPWPHPRPRSPGAWRWLPSTGPAPRRPVR